VLDRIQQHPHQVDGVIEMLKRPADVPGVRPGGIGQLRVDLVLLVVSPSGQIREVVLALFPDVKACDVSEVRRWPGGRCRSGTRARISKSVDPAAAGRTAMAGNVVGWLAAT
jgi:hypothetical protein